MQPNHTNHAWNTNKPLYVESHVLNVPISNTQVKEKCRDEIVTVIRNVV